MPVDGVGGASSLYNEMLAVQTDAVANNSEMTMDDFWKLLAAQLQYQDMTNPMSNSEMMNQMTQMATMNAMTQVSNAISNFGIVTNNLSQVTLTSYSTGLIGKEVTVATVGEDGEVNGEIKGVVTGVDLTGAQSVYVDGKKYSLSQIMTVGDVPKEDEKKPQAPVEKPEETAPGSGAEPEQPGSDAEVETPDNSAQRV